MNIIFLLMAVLGLFVLLGLCRYLYLNLQAMLRSRHIDHYMLRNLK